MTRFLLLFTAFIAALALPACSPDDAAPSDTETAEDIAPPSASPADSAAEDGTPTAPPDSAGLAPSPPVVASTTEVGGCDVRQDHGYCYTYAGDGWNTERAQAECAGAPNSAFVGSCPAGERIGRCVYNPGDDAARQLIYYFYAPMDPQLAQLSCPPNGRYEPL
ncbi:MAG TPA: hypothetical protein VD962_12155 [Rubricoccaceae bacterium]|nr:hypothetical protein [Rubricoccaceae bacterium]